LEIQPWRQIANLIEAFTGPATTSSRRFGLQKDGVNTVFLIVPQLIFQVDMGFQSNEPFLETGTAVLIEA
jgi:hypothetical protein